MTRTADELSIVCEESRVPDGIKVERNWVALKLEGPFPFSMTGVLASFIEPLAKHKISIFAIATFDTDYVLIKRENLEAALRALAEAGHEMRSESRQIARYAWLSSIVIPRPVSTKPLWMLGWRSEESAVRLVTFSRAKRRRTVVQTGYNI